MKKCLFFFFVSLVLVGCSETPSEKAEDLIKAEMPNTLILPDSYDPISTQVDSAFYPLDSPELLAQSYKLFLIAQEIEEVKNTAETEKSSMMLWADSRGEYGQNEYMKCKAKYEDASQKSAKLLEKGKTMAEDIKNMLADEPKFIGYKAIHKYRAKNNAGQVIMGENYIVLNQDLSKIELNVSTEDPAYIASKQVIAELDNN